MANKKKIATSVAAVATAAALVLGGTFAWQSISQTALNEKEAVINPGGRLHDDFNGTNKDVYVENFADDDIFARVRLDEYFEIVMNKGVEGAEETQVVTTGATKDDTYTYITHKFDAENATDDWWNWTTGGSTVYMPTFNKNKDSLVADINGTFENDYADYVEYEKEESKEATAIYDSDSNAVDEVGIDFDNLDEYINDGNIKTVTENHTAAETGTATLISMEEWLELADNGEDTDNYWVYDTDGWVYYSSPIKSGTATGLLLDEISLNQVMDDSYYYAINVVGQFITADDLGKDDNTGFYADGETPTRRALTLLDAIGVTVDKEDLIPKIDVPKGDEIYFLTTERKNDEYYDLTIFSAAENLTDEQIATAAESLNLGNVIESATYRPTNLEKTVTVSFANKVSPTATVCWFKDLGSEATVIPTFDFSNLDTSNITCMQQMFEGCAARKLDVSSWNVSNVTNMYSMFEDCDVEELDVSGWDVSNVTNMYLMFKNCSNLKELDLSNWNTSKVEEIRMMFMGCTSLTKLNLKNFNTSNVEGIWFEYMFYNCESLTELDLSSFDTSKSTSFEQMFGNCKNLTNLNISSFDVSNATSMKWMFSGAEKLTLDCSDWNVDKVTDYYGFNENATGVIAPAWVN